MDVGNEDRPRQAAQGCTGDWQFEGDSSVSMLCLVLQEYGLMMDAEIGIYAIRAQAMLLSLFLPQLRFVQFLVPGFEAPVCNKPI